MGCSAAVRTLNGRQHDERMTQDFSHVGDLRPGSSPGSVTFSPMVVFANSNTILVELGGTAAGTLHDQLTFTSAATAAGLVGRRTERAIHQCLHTGGR